MNLSEEQLLKELELARQERKEIEKKREDLVKKAKNLQTKTQSKRNQGENSCDLNSYKIIMCSLKLTSTFKGKCIWGLR